MKRTLFTSSFKRIVSVIAVVAITLFMVSKISFILENKTSYKNYASFFSKEEDYDVLFVGSSHVRYGFYPMELWKQYGITSYNLAGDASTLPVDYWILKQAFHYHVPKVIVLDVYDCAPNAIVYRWEHVHDSTGAFPISLDKIRMVRDLGRNHEWVDGMGDPTEVKWDMVFKIAEYHERWSKLGPTDFDTYQMIKEQSEVRKGAKPLTEIAVREAKVYPDVIDAKYDDTSKEYLEKIIELCNQKGCQVLLVNTGYDCNEAAKLFADSVPEIADKYGLEYYDFTNMDLINFDCDLQTTGDNTHVNASGGVKFSKFIGDVLVNNYQIADHREDASCGKWHEDYNKYVSYIEDTLKSISTFDEYLELLYGWDYDITIDIYDDAFLQEGANKPILENLGVDVSKISDGTELVLRGGAEVEYSVISEASNGYRAKVTVYDSKNQRTVDEKSF